MSGGILDARELAKGGVLRDTADVVVVGSGAGGATVARVLAEAGLDVIVVEEGPHVPPAERTPGAYESFRTLWRDGGFQVAKGRAFLPVLQGSCVGGTTVINGAIQHRLPERVFAAWAEERGLARAFSYGELDRVFTRIEAELSIAEAPRAILGGNNRLLARATSARGISGQPIHRNVADCRASSRCNQGCPTGRKQSLDRTFLPYAVERGARVYANAVAAGIRARHGRAAAVTGTLRDGSGSFDLEARRAVVVSAGAIHTPLLLRASGLRHAALGEHLQAHPAASVLGLFDEPVEMWSGATQGFETLAYWNDGMKMETAGVPLEILAARLPGFGEELKRAVMSAAHVAQWGVEVRAKARGRVRASIFGKPDIRYDMGDDDVRLLKRGLYRLCELYFAAGAREVMPGVHGLPARTSDLRDLDRIFDLPDDPRLFHAITGHVFATAAMGAEPARSVVGLDGQSREMPGLYVMDASILPTNIGVNPQHSISGVSWLLAERLATA